MICQTWNELPADKKEAAMELLVAWWIAIGQKQEIAIGHSVMVQAAFLEGAAVAMNKAEAKK